MPRGPAPSSAERRDERGGDVVDVDEVAALPAVLEHLRRHVPSAAADQKIAATPA